MATVTTMDRGVLAAAIAQADERAAREGRRMTVYHTARDRYGRDAVFYVRADDEGGAPWDEARGAEAVTVYVVNPGRVTRWVLTHVAADGLRVLSFPAQGRWTYATREEAEEARTLWTGPEGLPRVLTPEQVKTVEVWPVECWPGHHDPCRTVF